MPPRLIKIDLPFSKPPVCTEIVIDMGLLQAVAAEAMHLYAFRYITLAGTSVLVYDTLLTFPEELRFVWHPLVYNRQKGATWKSNVSRVLYLLNRYFMITIAIMLLICLIPTGTMTNLWLGTCLLLSSFIINCTLVATFTFADTVKIAGTRNFMACVITEMPILFLGSWIPCALFDTVAFILLLLNALSRPRQADAHLMKVLYIDGIIFFLINFTTAPDVRN
ncbi:uncharacterized protein FOMMEDRAFT_27033 [Fomitiporia mediterranea MF3/22]|uniref:uncharacterized protein n=1 Tax=Fomitiporia mediterranea (strain MF3/22) TaxID=694068 RepID=UPI0004407ADF|nr:uncharacterized protein FOMMEDRAFT_27033 [Fomitiporia mediterranea MF3/22]EJD04690.1 hypothetical protein FOMMEDRAFT_27033 [Fomitiporia mediterranea MF3/22]